MALPTAASERQLEHRRNIDEQIFARGNGLWAGLCRRRDHYPRWYRAPQSGAPMGSPPPGGASIVVET